MKKIKVAEVITRLDWGGSPDIIRLIAAGLNQEKFEIRLISGVTRYPTRETEQFLNEFKEKIIFIPQLQREINPLFDLIALLKLYKLFRKEKFDIVHTHTAKAGVLGRMAAKMAGKNKIIHMSHGHNFYGYFGLMGSKLVVILERLLAPGTNKFITLTELEKKDLINYKITHPTKIEVIPTGLNLEKYKDTVIKVENIKKELQLKNDTLIIGMIGRLEPIKGIEYLIQAAGSVIKEIANIKFLIIGEGSLRKKLELQCQKSGLNDYFIFTGWREDIPQLLSVLDILVLPSLNEAVGRILIEAGACGVPVVATKVGGIPEIVIENKTGILVPAKDADSLAQAIITVLKDKNRRAQMSETAKSYVKDKFNSSIMVERIAELYEKIIND